MRNSGEEGGAPTKRSPLTYFIPVYIILRMPLIRTDSHSEFRISYITDLYYLDSLA